MKALVLKSPNVLEYEDRDTQGNFKIKYFGVCSSDLNRIFNNGSHKYPLVLGHEIYGIYTDIDRPATIFPIKQCGECEACKSGYPNLCQHYSYIGSREDGGWQEEFTVGIKNIVLTSNYDIMEHLRCLQEPIAVVLNAYEKIKFNRKILILGSGFIGVSLALFLSSLNKDFEITIYDRNDYKLELLKEVENSVNIINTLNLGETYDGVVDCIDISLYKKAFEKLKFKGDFVIIGNQHNKEIREVNLFEPILRKELTVKGVWNYTYIDFCKAEEVLYILQDKLNKFITVVNFSDLKEYLYSLNSQKRKPIKIVCKVGE